MRPLQRGRLHLLDLVGNGGSWRLPAAMRPAVMNFVSVVIYETRNGAVGSDGPAGPDVEDSHGIEIQRIGVLPVDAEITADVFAVWSDGHPPPIIDVGHSGAVAAGLLRGKSPGLAFVAGIRGDAGRARVIQIVAANSNDFLFIPAREGENSRGGVAMGHRCFRDGPGASRVREVKDPGGRDAGTEKDVYVGEYVTFITCGKRAFVGQH